jgi:putative endonuclease
MVHGGFIYILTNIHHTTLYVGVTSDLYSRLSEHKAKIYPTSFTSRYNLNKLVYFEVLPSIQEAIAREKYIKGKVRKWKNDLIASSNPEWRDLSDDVLLFPSL